MIAWGDMFFLPTEFFVHFEMLIVCKFLHLPATACHKKTKRIKIIIKKFEKQTGNFLKYHDTIFISVANIFIFIISLSQVIECNRAL